MIVDEDEPIVLHEVVQAALSNETLGIIDDSGLSVLDVLAGTVLDLDPIEIITAVWEDLLPADEYARCMARLPELLAEYERSG